MSAQSHADDGLVKTKSLFCKCLRSYLVSSLLICRRGSRHLKICASLWFKGSDLCDAGLWYLWHHKGCENPDHWFPALRLDCNPSTTSITSFSLVHCLVHPKKALQGQSLMQSLLRAVYHKQILFDISFITFLFLVPYLRWWKGPADDCS